jgi:hypothetical protein
MLTLDVHIELTADDAPKLHAPQPHPAPPMQRTHRTQHARALDAPPLWFWALFAAYSAASLAHFTHNAQYIAYYPNMPKWIGADTVYLAWLGVASVGAAGLVARHLGFGRLALLCFFAYGALGLDGLAHYTLALCSEHTFMANLTIWSEVLTGLFLLLVSAVMFSRRLKERP